MEQFDLDAHRRNIDRCDKEIVRLINERAGYAQKIGEVKRKAGLPVYAPDRETRVYQKVEALNQGPLPNRAIHAVYREIMSGTIALEGATRIAYLGPLGTFSHMAALEKFGSSMEYIPCREIRDVFLSLKRGHADYGVVPIENSTEGSVNQTSEMFMETDLKICSELYVGIHHNLLATCALHEVNRIASHPQALAQCRNWLAANAASVEIVESASTTAAACQASEESGTAAIASDIAASMYDLHVLERGIEDRCDNVTRFVVLAHSYGKPTGHDRTSIMFSLRDEAGCLAEKLLVFRDAEINLTRIESRPSRRRAWEYTFFVDFEGHVDEAGAQTAVRALRAVSHDLVVLGSYPRAERVRAVAPARGEEEL